MEKILVVYGNSGTGKTTVINDIYDYLIKKNAVIVTKRKKTGGNERDFTAVVSYKGKNIAFLSMGDYRKDVDVHVEKFKKNDIFITALNKKFSCIGSVWLENSNAIYKFDKKRADSIDNQNVMEAVISKI